VQETRSLPGVNKYRDLLREEQVETDRQLFEYLTNKPQQNKNYRLHKSILLSEQ